MSLIELLVAILYIFIGINTAILISHEFNIFIGFLSFFMTVYISYYLLYEFAFKILNYFHKCGRKITKFNKKRMIREENKILGWIIFICFIVGFIIGYIYIPLLGYMFFVVNFILGYLVHLIYLYICYNLNICKRKK